MIFGNWASIDLHPFSEACVVSYSFVIGTRLFSALSFSVSVQFHSCQSCVTFFLLGFLLPHHTWHQNNKLSRQGIIVMNVFCMWILKSWTYRLSLNLILLQSWIPSLINCFIRYILWGFWEVLAICIWDPKLGSKVLL